MNSAHINELKERGLATWLIFDDQKIDEIPFDFNLSMDKCWNLTVETGNVVKSIGLNGKTSWAPFKERLDKIERPTVLTQKMKQLLSEHYKVEKDDFEHNNCTLTIDSISMKHFDKSDKLWESHHFLIQHFRIIAMCDDMIPINKLLQLAYNAGQFNADRKKYDERVIAFYDANKLGDIGTYI
jgi:hypothetical protein